MSDTTAFEQQLSAGFKGLMGPSEPVDVNAIFAATITATQSHTWRFGSMFSATKFVVAGAIVALFGGMLLAGLLTTQPDKAGPIAGASTAPTVIPEPARLPTDIPAGVESGTLETPLGQARWVHLTGDEDTLPTTLTSLLSTPDGYVVAEFNRRAVPGRRARLWRSTDLIEWTAESLSIAGKWGSLSQASDTYWLRTTDPVSLWRSADTVSWEQVSLEGLHPPGPAGKWLLTPGMPVTHEGTTIVPLTWSPEAVTRARSRETADTEVLALGILEDGALIDGEPPLWLEHPRQQAFMADQDGFLAYTLGADDPSTLAPDPLVYVHRSQDGRAWSETDIIGDDPGEPRVVESIYAWRGLVRMYVAANRTWTADDGLRREPFPPGGVGFRVGDGWLVTPMLTDQTGVTVVPDQGKAMQFDDTDLSFPSAACASDEALLSSNTFAVVGEEDCAWPREAWIITFDDVLARQRGLATTTAP